MHSPAIALFLTLACLNSAQAFFGLGSCEYTKQDCKQCAMQKCDFDQDGKISAVEVQFIFEHVLTGAARWAALKFTSPDIALDHCGDPETGYITDESFDASEKCIEYCFEKRMFQSLVCDVLDRTDGTDPLALKFKAFADERPAESHNSELADEATEEPDNTLAGEF